MTIETIAKRISLVLNPLTALLVVTFVVAFGVSSSFEQTVAGVIIILFFSVLLPVCVVVKMLRSGQVKDLFISKRAERMVPLMLSVGSGWIGLAMLYLSDSPPALMALMMCVAVLGVVAFVMTARWKISLHAMGLWASWGIIMVLYGWSGWPAALPAGVVSWARFALGVHSMAQIVAGSMIGAGVAFVVFGYMLSLGV